MKESDLEARARFLEEAGIRLKDEGFEVGAAEDGLLPVVWNGAPLCRVNGAGGVRYRDEALRRPGASEALERVVGIADTVAEYMRLLEKAPELDAVGLDESYKKLTEFNGAVLAAHQYPNNQGWQFITWGRDYNGKDVCHGHYMGPNYTAAKRDFAVRAGLVPRNMLFSEDQLTEIYRCVSDVQDMDFPKSADRETRMDGIINQIRNCLPDLDARIGQAQNMDGEVADQTLGSQMM